MKRLLRILIIGPMMIFMLVLMSAVCPLVLALDWLFDEPQRHSGLRELWVEVLRGVWG